MTENTHSILIVDDSATDIHFIMQSIKSEFSVLVAKNGQTALDIALEKQPDVILLDVEMPEMNGYEVCTQLKNNPTTANIDIIFVSAHDTAEEKLAGYDVGGSDYLIKPINPVEIAKKVQIAIQRQQQKKELELEKSSAFETAMMVMSSSGELGVVLEFLRSAFSVQGLEGLGRHIINTLKNGYGIESCVQIRTESGQYDFSSSSGTPSPLEKELLFKLKDGERFMERGPRLIINFGDISLLIKNMPPEDQEVRGRMKDNVAMLLEGAEARLHSSEIMETQVQDLIDETQSVLANIKESQQKQMEQSIHVMDEVVLEMEETFLSLGLTEEQEQVLMNIVQDGVSKSIKNVEKGNQVTEQFQHIAKTLEKLIK